MLAAIPDDIGELTHITPEMCKRLKQKKEGDNISIAGYPA